MFTVDVPNRVDPSFIAPLLTFGPNASQSEYRGVYPYPKGGWVARIRIPDTTPGRAPLKNISGVVQSPTQAAYILAKWYETRYGKEWPRVVQARSELGRWCVPWQPRYYDEWGVWYLRVWEHGKVRAVTKLSRDGKPTRTVAIFPTSEEAVEFFPKWAKRRYGEDADRVLYRL